MFISMNKIAQQSQHVVHHLVIAHRPMMTNKLWKCEQPNEKKNNNQLRFFFSNDSDDYKNDNYIFLPILKLYTFFLYHQHFDMTYLVSIMCVLTTLLLYCICVGE